MPANYKVLGQSAPAATTATTLYTVPTSTEAVISTLVVANRDVGPATYRVSVRPGGASQANQHYLAFDVQVNGADSTTLTLGITLAATDVVTIYASTANLSFNLFGSEITA
jgi:hypothetical protein